VDVTAYLQAGCGYCSRVLHVGAVRVDRTDGSLLGNLWLLLWLPVDEPQAHTNVALYDSTRSGA
jgi:hypothetical protein